MRSLQTYRYEIRPNNVQRTLLVEHAGAARWAWNWGLQRYEEIRLLNELPIQRVKLPTGIGLHRELNALKEKQFPWLYNVSKCAPQEALRDLDLAFKRFFSSLRTGPRRGHPRFKRKGVHDSFRLTGNIHVVRRSVRLPRIGSVRTKEGTNVKGRILSATVRRQADRRFVSLRVERDRPDPVPSQGPAVGVDFGVAGFVTSDGVTYETPRPLRARLRALRRLSRKHARKKRGSRNRRKSATRIARLHYRIKCTRRDWLHKFTSELARTKRLIVIEDLSVSGMMRSGRMARSVVDAGFGQARRMLAYKTTWYGSELLVGDRWFPSSKLCHECLWVNATLQLRQRVWICPACGARHVRESNAAVNLRWHGQFGRNPDACGDPSTGEARASRHGSVKQEVNAASLLGCAGKLHGMGSSLGIGTLCPSPPTEGLYLGWGFFPSGRDTT